MLNISKDQIGGLLFLCLSIVYGYHARQIALMPGDGIQPFNAQTLPTILAGLGFVLSIALLLTAKKGFQNRLDLVAYKFSVVGKLLLLIILFGIALEWLGFAVSTVFFLIGGFWILGERRPKTVLTIAISFSVCTWLILSQLLDVYLAPGKVFNMLLGG